MCAKHRYYYSYQAIIQCAPPEMLNHTIDTAELDR